MDQLQRRVKELEGKVRLYEEQERLHALLKKMEESALPAPPAKKNSK
jgi:hypothetical protein